MYMRRINIDTANGHDEFDFIGNEFVIFDKGKSIIRYRPKNENAAIGR